jgi:hypothetical protein
LRGHREEMRPDASRNAERIRTPQGTEKLESQPGTCRSHEESGPHQRAHEAHKRAIKCRHGATRTLDSL